MVNILILKDVFNDLKEEFEEMQEDLEDLLELDDLEDLHDLAGVHDHPEQIQEKGLSSSRRKRSFWAQVRAQAQRARQSHTQ